MFLGSKKSERKGIISQLILINRDFLEKINFFMRKEEKMWDAKGKD